MATFEHAVEQCEYVDRLDELLRPRISRPERILDLFAGCGGLALGFESVGFETIGYEANADSAATYNKNLVGRCHVEFLTPSTVYPEADIVIGGPPCQPFSVGGKQMGLEDSRDGFPAFIAAVEQVKPRLFMFENVRGLLYRNSWYLKQVVARLERLEYIVQAKLLNAIDYGVPQNRERVIVVGHKGGFQFPEPSGLRVTVRDALGSLLLEEPEDGKYLTESMDRYVAKYEKASKCITPRDLHPNRAARTITCRNLAGATGDMQRIKVPSGRRRRLTVREGARLQSFPDWFSFTGSESEQFKQVGNAVAPMFSFALASSVKVYLDQQSGLSKQDIASSWSMVQGSLNLS